MFHRFGVLVACGLLAALAACSSPEEEIVYVEPDPIEDDSTHSGKYK